MRLALPLTLLTAPLPAQERTPSNCIALSQGPERVMAAAFRDPVPAARCVSPSTTPCS